MGIFDMFSRARNVVNAAPPSQYPEHWPPVPDRARIARYERGLKLFDGRHEDILKKPFARLRDDANKRPYVTVNMCAEITGFLTDKLCGTAPVVQGATEEAQAFIDRVLEASNWWVDLPNFTSALSFRGDAFVKVRWDADTGEILLEALNPANCFVRTEAGQPVSVVHAWIEGHAGRNYLVQEEHTCGQIATRAYVVHPDGEVFGFDPVKDRVNLDNIPRLAGTPDMIATGCEVLLIQHLPMNTAGEGFQWGRSDYADIVSLQGELNNRYWRRAHALDLHAAPYAYGPDISDEYGEIHWEQRYIALNPGEEPPGYLVWNAQLGAVENAIRDTKHDLVFTAGFSPASFDLGEGTGAPESGEALKTRAARSVSQVERRQSAITGLLQRCFVAASQLANSPAAAYRHDGGVPLMEKVDLRIEWADPYPATRQAAVDEVSAELLSGLISKRTARKRLYDMNEEESDAEDTQIDAERDAEPGFGLSEPLSVDAGGF